MVFLIASLTGGDPSARFLMFARISYRPERLCDGSFLPGRVFTSPADFNIQLADWLTRANRRIHRTLQARPADRLEADGSRMLALPPIAPSGWWKASLRLPRDHYVRLDTCDYSVHPLAVGRRVEVAADLDQVLVTCDGVEAARHVPDLVSRLVYISAWSCVQRANPIEYMQDPEFGGSAAHRAGIGLSGMPGFGQHLAIRDPTPGRIPGGDDGRRTRPRRNLGHHLGRFEQKPDVAGGQSVHVVRAPCARRISERTRFSHSQADSARGFGNWPVSAGIRKGVALLQGRADLGERPWHDAAHGRKRPRGRASRRRRADSTHRTQR
ncbi:hypothetical protein QFZ76_009967 [Streptomyces sp. V4I2]|nr:hypothetical protein [Streptomyces sp. V4I2]